MQRSPPCALRVCLASAIISGSWLGLIILIWIATYFGVKVGMVLVLIISVVAQSIIKLMATTSRNRL